jgi:hypothetical protein
VIVDIGGGSTELVAGDGDGVRWHAVTWDWPVRLGADRVGHERLLLRASTPTRPLLAPRLRNDSSLTGAVLAALDRGGKGRDDNEPLSRALVAVAAGIVDSHLRTGAAT